MCLNYISINFKINFKIKYTTKSFCVFYPLEKKVGKAQPVIALSLLYHSLLYTPAHG